MLHCTSGRVKYGPVREGQGKHGKGGSSILNPHLADYAQQQHSSGKPIIGPGCMHAGECKRGNTDFRPKHLKERQEVEDSHECGP